MKLRARWTLALLFTGAVPLAALMVAASASGAALASTARDAYGRNSLPTAISELEGPTVLEGLVAGDPRIVDDEMRFEVEATSVIAEGYSREYRGRVRIFVRSQAETPFEQVRRIRSGDEIRAWVDLRRPEPVRTPGGFDQLAWARREGIHAFATCKNERLLQITSPKVEPRTLLDLSLIHI